MMQPVFLRTEHNYDRNVASDESALVCDDESLAVQSEAEDADINTIVRRFGLTGQLPSNVRVPVSGDFSGAGNFHESMNMVLAAQEAFMQFPADVRKRFGHDPAELIAFVENPANYDEAVKLGIAMPRVAEAGAVKDAPTASPSPSA